MGWGGVPFRLPMTVIDECFVSSLQSKLPIPSNYLRYLKNRLEKKRERERKKKNTLAEYLKGEFDKLIVRYG